MIDPAPRPATDDEERREAFAVLRDMAEKRSPAIPAESLARHVLDVTAGADWPVVRAGMSALLRRLGFARRDELRIAARPPGGKRLGIYATRTSQRGGLRPYRTLLESVSPISGSCDCPDFTRNSLGLCKHLLVVLEDLHTSKRKLTQARREGTAAHATPMRWNPVRPLDGHGDWLAGTRWKLAEKPLRGKKVQRARKAFDTRTGRLKHTYAETPSKRLALVQKLLTALPARDRQAPSDPALRALLIREQAKLTERVKTRPLAKRSSWARGLKRKLYPYQVEGVERFLQTGRLLLGDDMGLGKTTQAIAACHALVSHGHVRRGLIIAPASLKWQWLREWQQVTDLPAAIVEGPPYERHEQYASHKRGFLIMNYELLLRDAPHLQGFGADMVVLDEAQRIKNWATKTAAHVKALRVPYRLVLTGTPMENRLEELASIYDWVDDVALEPKWRLVPWHSIQVQDGERGETVGARNLTTLRTRMSDTFLRRVRHDVLSQLPPRTETRIPVPLTLEQHDAHKELEQPIARLIHMSRRRPLKQSEFLRLMSLLTTQRVICNGIAQLEYDTLWPTLPDDGPQSELQLRGLFAPKLFELRRLIQDLAIEQGRKVVIFSQWRRMLRLAAWSLSDILAPHGQRAVFFTGAESQKQRTRGLVELHDDPHTTLMFLSDAGGVGLNLQRAASACINLELPWNPAVLEQRIGRIYRLGQTEPVDIFNLVSETGIEAHIADVVSAKQELFTGLFDGTTDEVMFSSAGSGMSQIEKLVDATALADDVPPQQPLDDLTPVEDDLVPTPSPAPTPTIARSDNTAPSHDTPRPRPAASPQPASDVRQLLSSLSVRPTPNGGITIEAPPEAAQSLAMLFKTMGELIEQTSSSP